MSDDGWREIAEWDWVYIEGREDDDTLIIHAVNTGGGWDEEGVTECGIEGWLSIPGIFSRMSEHTVRCPGCCAATGMPEGTQSPKNIDACRPVCEARLERLADGNTTQEIVEWLHTDEATRLLLTQSFPRLTDGLHACADEVARRFPNEKDERTHE